MLKTTLVQQSQQATLVQQTNSNIIYPLDILDVFEKELPKINFVFRGLKAGTLGFLTSAGGVGKSMLATQLAISLADTTKQYNLYPFVNSKTKRGKIVYINLEDPVDIIAKRVKKILNFLIEHKNINNSNNYFINNIRNNLLIYPFFGTNYSLYKNKVVQESVKNNLIQLATVTSARLMIIDTFRRLHDGNENDNGEMSEILKILENVAATTGTAILLLHHQNKATIGEENLSQSIMRGASALADNARLVITMQTLTEKEAKKMDIDKDERFFYTKVNYAKVNYSAPIAPVIFKKEHSILNLRREDILRQVFENDIVEISKQKEMEDLVAKAEDLF